MHNFVQKYNANLFMLLLSSGSRKCLARCPDNKVNSRISCAIKRMYGKPDPFVQTVKCLHTALQSGLQTMLRCTYIIHNKVTECTCRAISSVIKVCHGCTYSQKHGCRPFQIHACLPYTTYGEFITEDISLSTCNELTITAFIL